MTYSFEQFKREVLDMTDGEEGPEGTPAEDHSFDGDHTSVAWAKEPPRVVREMEEVKDALITEHHEDHFGGDHPSDHLSDDEIWASLPESFRPWGDR